MTIPTIVSAFDIGNSWSKSATRYGSEEVNFDQFIQSIQYTSISTDVTWTDGTRHEWAFPRISSFNGPVLACGKSLYSGRIPDPVKDDLIYVVTIFPTSLSVDHKRSFS